MREYARKRWVEGLPYRMREAVTEAKKTGRDAAEAVLTVDACSAAVDDVMSCVQRRVVSLKEQAQQFAGAADPSRRGAL